MLQKGFGAPEKNLNELPNIQEAASLPLLFTEMFPKENNLCTAQGV